MLDLARVNQQISRMAVEQQLVAEDRLKRLDKALGQLALESERLPGFIRKLQASKTSWLLAGIRESLDNTYALPPRPLAITVVATDGSQIAPSHHEVIPAFLLNISTVVLHYGTGERAELSRPADSTVRRGAFRRDPADLPDRLDELLRLLADAPFGAGHPRDRLLHQGSPEVVGTPLEDQLAVVHAHLHP